MTDYYVYYCSSVCHQEIKIITSNGSDQQANDETETNSKISVNNKRDKQVEEIKYG